MNKTTYLKNADVVNFIEWVIPKIDTPGNFKHAYKNLRPRLEWSCDSIYNAYKNYRWGFNCTLPNNEERQGSSYQESEEVLNAISVGLKKSLNDRNATNLLAYSISALQWGGVTNANLLKLQEMNEGILTYFDKAIKELSPETVDVNSNFDNINMNSGFTKIYSFLMEDFVIYDSRVGAALGYLVRQFLIDTNAQNIPDVLDFAYGNARPTNGDDAKFNRRNPSCERFIFKALNNNRKRHIKNNIYANWLLKEIAGKSSMFNKEENSLRKLESALFMIGYSLRG